MKLRDWREKEELTSAEFAALAGVSESAIRHYETGVRRPRTDTAKKIEMLTRGEVSALELLGLEGKNKRVRGVSEHGSKLLQAPTKSDAALLEEARSMGIDPDAVARKAVEDAVKRARIEAWVAENRDAFAAHAHDIEENGLWSDGLRLF